MASRTITGIIMKMFVAPGEIYLCRDPVDFKKAINGLTVLLEQQRAR